MGIGRFFEWIVESPSRRVTAKRIFGYSLLISLFIAFGGTVSVIGLTVVPVALIAAIVSGIGTI